MPDVLALALAGAATLVTLGGASAILWWLVKPRVQGWAQEQIIGPLHETRHQVSENHHSSERPTILDRLDDVEGAANRAASAANRCRDDLNKHLLVSGEESRAMWSAIEAVAKSEPPAQG